VQIEQLHSLTRSGRPATWKAIRPQWHPPREVAPAASIDYETSGFRIGQMNRMKIAYALKCSPFLRLAPNVSASIA
jgi:hypothetical protein